MAFVYSPDAGNTAIYSVKRSEKDESWMLMNRTVPTGDYTGRAIYVSHTLAFRLDELMDFLAKKQGKISSVFEFMWKFEWKSSWSSSETPQWIEESADLEASSLEAFNYTDLDESKFPINLLSTSFINEEEVMMALVGPELTTLL
jgi:hypothetical protein